MNRKLLPNDQWERIKDLLPGKKGDPGKTGGDNRLFIEVVLWIARTGSPWRDLLPAFGNWHSVYTRYSRWGKKGVWKRLLEQISSIAQSFEFISMAQVQKKEGPQAIGRSRGGLTTKIHLAVDALGNPLRSILTAGQDSDIIQAPALIEGLDPDMVIADKAYDANDFIQMIQGMRAMVVIPVRSATNNESMIITGTKTETWWSVPSIKLNSFAVLPRAMKSLIATSCLCSTWCVPSSGWHEC